jgi:hypothetical protein
MSWPILNSIDVVVDIGGIVDHQCLIFFHFLFDISYDLSVRQKE